MSTSFIKSEVLYGNMFYKAASFTWQQVLYVNKFYESRHFVWQQFLYQQVLIDNKFYVATGKQVFFYKATRFTSDGKCSIFENKFYLW